MRCVIALLAVCGFLHGQLRAEDAKGPPKIVFDHTACDFKTLYSGDDPSHVFTFRNAGERDLVIQNVTSTCRCTMSQLDGKVIRPGESGELRLTFHSRDYYGAVERSVYVRSNDPATPQATLSLKAFVRPDGAVFRPRAVQCGDMPGGQTREFTVEMDQGRQKMKVTRIDSSVEGVSAAATPGPNAETVIRIKICVNPSKLPPGRFIEFLTIYTDCERYPMYEIPVRGNVISAK